MIRRNALEAAEKPGALDTGLPTAIAWLLLLLGAGLWAGRWLEGNPLLAYSFEAALGVTGLALLWLSLRAARREQIGDVVGAHRFARLARALGALMVVSLVLVAAGWLRFGHMLLG